MYGTERLLDRPGRDSIVKIHCRADPAMMSKKSFSLYRCKHDTAEILGDSKRKTKHIVCMFAGWWYSSSTAGIPGPREQVASLFRSGGSRHAPTYIRTGILLMPHLEISNFQLLPPPRARQQQATDEAAAPANNNRCCGWAISHASATMAASYMYTLASGRLPQYGPVACCQY